MRVVVVVLFGFVVQVVAVGVVSSYCSSSCSRLGFVLMVEVAVVPAVP